MNWGSPFFVIAIVLISTAGWLINNWIRARHGYPVEREWGGTDGREDIGANRKVELLTQENERLNGQVARLEERLAVLERIATDPASRIAKEIDALR
jgi:hypothetical protein